MKTLSPAFATAVAKTVTVPGYLVEIDFATPVYLSSLTDVSFAGHIWVATDIQVAGIHSDGRGRSGGQLTLANGDQIWSALILGEGIADKRIRIWAFDGTAVAAADIQPLFDGAGDSAVIDQPCVVQLTSARSIVAVSPRRFIGLGTGFNHLSAAGRVIRIGQDTLTLNRGD